MFCVKQVINPSYQSGLIIMLTIDLERLMARLFSLLSGRPLSILHIGVVFPFSFHATCNTWCIGLDPKADTMLRFRRRQSHRRQGQHRGKLVLSL